MSGMSAQAASIGIVAYLALFAFVGVVFLLANLLVGRIVRPVNPHPEKLEIYECGEPTIGSSFVQFDLRFYVVALLFIIFDVEVAFFFPWATVFGKATNLADPQLAIVATAPDGTTTLTAPAAGVLRELGVRDPQLPARVPEMLATPYRQRFGNQAPTSPAAASYVVRAGSRHLAVLTIIDIMAFFGVLMLGFLYVWKRGDLDWVRAVGRERALQRDHRAATLRSEPESVLSA